MTLEELNQFLALRQTLLRDEEILASLEARAVPGAQVLTGMPHAPGVSNKVELFAVEIADMKERIRELQAQIAEEAVTVEAFIAGIEPDWTRMMFRLRYIRAFPWKAVADIMGGGNTEESVKMTCYRYLASVNPVP